MAKISIIYQQVNEMHTDDNMAYLYPLVLNQSNATFKTFMIYLSFVNFKRVPFESHSGKEKQLGSTQFAETRFQTAEKLKNVGFVEQND